MGTYRRFIINFTIHDILFSFTLGVLSNPDPLFPYSGFVINGLFRHLGSYGAFAAAGGLVATAGYALSTQCACIIYRFAVLQEDPRIVDFVVSTTTWIVCYISAFGVCIFAASLLKQFLIPQELILGKMALVQPYINQKLPNISGKVVVYFDYDNTFAAITGGAVFFGFFAAEFISFGCVFMILHELEAKKESFSSITYKLHRQLTIALGAQLLTPFIFIIFPVTLGILATYNYWSVNESYSQFFVISIDFYGAANSLITLYFVKPYRVYLSNKLKLALRYLSCGRFGKGPEVIVVMAPETTLASIMG
ncbi:unnamed protein product [Bursaphelenchus xylophilus]|uniref:(pine wood nematode) hypothetical protein n=1 Tax=Bursaphelenchus xylophilus TaxID=6326 RepID=A0A1I7RZH1_BURXY|nr:unnamed protein product [Bursaphelenchus xylophilus]CAG9106394.1 unnamed protein product [Bursaphelenchus xylophilus]